MLEKYPVDSAFNKNLVFAYQPPPVIELSKLPILPKNWLANLQKIIYEIDNKLPKNIFDNHLNEASNYRAKSLLLKQLQLIFHRLQGNLDSELGKLSSDKRLAIVNKLTEDIDYCSEGFHNRVNIIVDSFYKPRDLAELLYTARKNLVDEVASIILEPKASEVSKIPEVHAWNRISVIAAIDGLGIKANFPDDNYIGALPDKTIRCALQQAFYKKFTPYHLPSLLIASFMEFIPELESEKNNKNGLSLEMKEKVIHLIERFLPNYINAIPNHPNNWLTYFKVFRDKKNPFVFSLVNLDWEKIYRSFFSALSDQNYFVTVPKINTLIDSACHNLFLKPPFLHSPAELISELFKEERYADLVEQLVELNTRFPKYYQKISKHKIFTKNCLAFIDYLTRQLKICGESPTEILQAFQLIIRLDLHRKHFIIGKIVDAFLEKNKSGFNLLMFAAQYSPDFLEAMLIFLKKYKDSFAPKLIKKMFLMKNRDNLNALMIAAIYHSNAVEMLLDFIGNNIQDLDHTILQNFFLESTNNCNVLMLAASKQAEAIGAILGFLNTHIGRFANDTLRNLFTQKQKDSFTAVTLTARDHPEWIQSVLSFITDHIKIDGETLRKLLFIENSKQTCTALVLAVKNQAEAAFYILKFISENIESFNRKILWKMFLDKDPDGFTILMLAARYQPIVLQYLVQFINKHISLFPEEILIKILLDTNLEDYNCLMLAAEFQPFSIPTILNFINIFKFFKLHIEKMLFTENQKGCNSLLLARHHPEALLSLIGFIQAQPEGVISVTLEQIFLKKSKSGFTLLMHLARDKANSLALIFELFEKNPQLITRETWPKLIIEKNKLAYNSLMLAARNQYDSAIHVLNFIIKHPEIFSADYLNQLFLEHDKNGITTLMIAAKYKPEVVRFFLNFIQSRPEIFSAKFINQFLIAHDKNKCNALMVAATYQPKVVEFLLEFLSDNINLFNKETLHDFIFKSIHDKEAANAVFFGGRYDYRKSVLSVTARIEDRTAISALLKFIDKHIELLGINIFADLLTEKDNDENYIFRPTCAKYPFIMKNVLNFLADSVNNEALITVQDLSAYFILEQFARWSIETSEDQMLFDKVTLNCFALLLIYFNKDFFAERPNNLKIVTDKLFSYYLYELEDLKAKKVTYTTKFSFFKWRCSTPQKLEAAHALERVLDRQDFDIGPALLKLKDQYWAFSESGSKLSHFFAAYQEINALKTNDACEFDLENDAVHLKHAKVA